MNGTAERECIGALRAQPFDVAIVGGGMHGAWLAWRAAAAGLRTALVERADFGAGTTANSLRILHGGLRYLQHADVSRMRASIEARREFARIAPVHVRPLACVMPLQRRGVRSPWLLGPALLANDLIGADRNAGVPPSARLPRGRLLDGTRTRARLAPLAATDAFAGAQWWDAYADDPARLVLAPLLAASRAGARIANYVSAEQLLVARGRVHGVAVADRVGGARFDVLARVVVDATGPAGGALAAASGLPAPWLPPAWIAGANLVFAREPGFEGAIALRAASKRADGRALLKRAARELFFVAAPGATLVGTDYRRYPRADEAPPEAPADLVADFLDEIARVAPGARLRREELVRVHWGLLPAAASDDVLPARSPIVAAGARECGVAGLVAVIAEKLTTAPVLSRRVLGRVEVELARDGHAARSPRRTPRTRTGSSRGTHVREPTPSFVVTPPVEARLRARYGDGWRAPLRHALDRADALLPLAPDCAALVVEVLHALRAEWALTVDDVVVRRLGLGDAVEPEGLRAAVAAVIARECGSAQAAARAGAR